MAARLSPEALESDIASGKITLLEQEALPAEDELIQELQTSTRRRGIIALVMGGLGLVLGSAALLYSVGHQPTYPDYSSRFKQYDERLKFLQTQLAQTKSDLDNVKRSPTLQKEAFLDCVSMRARFYPDEGNHASPCTIKPTPTINS